MARPKVLPPGPGLSTRTVQAKVARQVRAYGRQVLDTLRPLFRDLNGPARPPQTALEKFAAGGLLALPPALGGVMSPADIRAWLERAEYPLLRAIDGQYVLTSGGDVLARALGAGARSVEVMLRDRDSVRRFEMRLTPGITHAQIASRLFDVPEVPDFDLGRDYIQLSKQATRLANTQVAALDMGRPFETTREQDRRFVGAARRSSRLAEIRAQQVLGTTVRSLRAEAGPPRLFTPEDVGRDVGVRLELRAEKQALVRSEQAARGVDQEAHEAEVESTRVRHERLGINRYMWISSRDERTRKRHLDLDGTVHSWDNPPEADPGQRYHPGARNNCRCTPSPLQSDILNALEGE